jgi:phosphoribosylformylglycinamidine synthase subunit PurL
VTGAADDPTFLPFDGSLTEAWLRLLSSPNIASKRWVFQQYDSLVQGQTVAGPGSTPPSSGSRAR